MGEHPIDTPEETPLLLQEQEGSSSTVPPLGPLGELSSSSSGKRKAQQVRLGSATTTSTVLEDDGRHNAEDIIPPHIMANMDRATERAQGVMVISGITYVVGVFNLSSNWPPPRSPSDDLLFTPWLGGFFVSCVMMVSLFIVLQKLYKELEPLREFFRTLIGGGRISLLFRHPAQYCRSALTGAVPHDFARIRRDMYEDLNEMRMAIIELFCGQQSSSTSKDNDTSVVDASTALLVAHDHDENPRTASSVELSSTSTDGETVISQMEVDLA
jgi:hypothetical protein